MMKIKPTVCFYFITGTEKVKARLKNFDGFFRPWRRIRDFSIRATEYFSFFLAGSMEKNKKAGYIY